MNKEEKRIYSLQWYYKNRTRVLKARRKEYIKIREKMRNKRALERKEVLELLGNKCIQCQESDWRCLQVDHIKGNGNAERRKHGGDLYARILQELKSGSKDYQCLCANCNWKKRYENKEWRGHNWVFEEPRDLCECQRCHQDYSACSCDDKNE
jgi:predicted glycosyl hydrolase (DUF1957 family)